MLEKGKRSVKEPFLILFKPLDFRRCFFERQEGTCTIFSKSPAFLTLRPLTGFTSDRNFISRLAVQKHKCPEEFEML